jgi:AraC-like DNA-binding protein
LTQPAIAMAQGARSVLAGEVDEYSTALPGISLDVVRTGRGIGPNIVRSHVWDDLTLASALVQFPLLGRTTVADDAVIVALVTDAPPTSQWCGIDLEPESMLLYGPGTEHTAITPVGLSFSFASIPIRVLEESAERRGMEFRIPETGRVIDLKPTSEVASVSRLLRSVGHLAPADEVAERRDAIVVAAGTMLSGDYSVGRGPGRRLLDSRAISNVCIDHVETVWDLSSAAGAFRTPSVRELCSVVYVSERRLRNAFYDTFGVAPLRYFRLRSLTRARGEFLRRSGSNQSVLGVAHDLGYSHVSRFAAYYREVYGEYPSATATHA